MNVVEADYELLDAYREGRVEFFDLSVFQYIQDSNCLSDMGIYDPNVLDFYRLPVVLGESYSQEVDGRLLIILLDPIPIRNVVDAVLKNDSVLRNANASDAEIDSLVQLKELLDIAVSETSYIEYLIDC